MVLGRLIDRAQQRFIQQLASSVPGSLRLQPLHQDKDVTIWKVGTPEAVKLFEAARWTGLDDPRIFDLSGPSAPHLCPDLRDQLDVVVVKTGALDWPTGENASRFCAKARSECPPGFDRWHLPDFNKQFLQQQLGFRTLTRSCLVLHDPDGLHDKAAAAAATSMEGKVVYASKEEIRRRRLGEPAPQPLPPVPAPPLPPWPPRILCLFLNGHTLPQLSATVSYHHELYSSMSQTFNPNDDRPGLFMAGIRCNDRQLTQRPGSPFSPLPPGALNVGYYSARGAAARQALADPRSRVHTAIRTACAAKAAMEEAVAPFVAQRRRGVADLLHHPGILPDIPRSEVPAFAVGVSKGFVNHIHGDQMYGGLTGTITWNTARVQPGAGHTFCVWSGKLLFDLQAHHASMVMIQGDVPHGTPGLPPPPVSTEQHSTQPASQGSLKQLHEGIGVVTITTDNLSTPFAKQQLHLFNRRIHDQGQYGRSFERYRHSELYRSKSAMYCPTCGEGGHPVPCGERLCTLADYGGVGQGASGGQGPLFSTALAAAMRRVAAGPECAWQGHMPQGRWTPGMG